MSYGAKARRMQGSLRFLRGLSPDRGRASNQSRRARERPFRGRQSPNRRLNLLHNPVETGLIGLGAGFIVNAYCCPRLYTAWWTKLWTCRLVDRAQVQFCWLFVGLPRHGGEPSCRAFSGLGTGVRSSGNRMSHRSISAADSRCGQSAVNSGTMTRTGASAPWRAISASSR